SPETETANFWISASTFCAGGAGALEGRVGVGTSGAGRAGSGAGPGAGGASGAGAGGATEAGAATGGGVAAGGGGGVGAGMIAGWEGEGTRRGEGGESGLEASAFR